MYILNDETVSDSSYANYTYGVVGRFAYLVIESNNVTLDSDYSVTFGTGEAIPAVAQGKKYNLVEQRVAGQTTYAILELDESE